MVGYQVVTGTWSPLPQPLPPAPSIAAINSLLPQADHSGFCLLQRPGVVSTGAAGNRGGLGNLASTAPRTVTTVLGGSVHPRDSTTDSSRKLQALQGLPFGYSSGMPAIPEIVVSDGDRMLQQLMLQQQHAAEQAADGHSSGQSGSGHMDHNSLMDKKDSAAVALESVGGASNYQLRTRSSSLRAAWAEVDDEEEPEEEEEDEDDEDDEAAAADSEGEAPAPRQAGKGSGKANAREAFKGKGKEQECGHKRVGRPLTYKGDPDAPHLTDQERRKIKRRIANRESARRVRQKRSELMDELQIKCTALGQQNARLLSHVAMVENQKNMLVQQVNMFQDKLNEKANEAVMLYNQLFQLRKHLPQEVLAQVERDAAATPPPTSPMPMQGAGMFVPITPHGAAANQYNSADLQALAFL